MQMNRVLIEYSYGYIILSEQQPGLVSKDAGNVSGSHRRWRRTEWDEDVTRQAGDDDEGGDNADHAAEWAEGAGMNAAWRKLQDELVSQSSRNPNIKFNFIVVMNDSP